MNDEQETLEACLDALQATASRVGVPVSIVVVLDACTDDSMAVVQRFSPAKVQAVTIDARCVGSARAAGMTELLRQHGDSRLWLATADADSVVPPHWLAGS